MFYFDNYCVLQTLNKKQLEEIERLQRKIRWYAENQELLDKDSAIMAKKDDEIKRLKIRLEQIETDVSVYVKWSR